MRSTRALTDETRGFLRNVGGLLAGFAVLMVALDIAFSLGGMLYWMDIPMLVGGLWLLAYAWRAPSAPFEGAPSPPPSRPPG